MFYEAENVRTLCAELVSRLHHGRKRGLGSSGGRGRIRTESACSGLAACERAERHGWRAGFSLEILTLEADGVIEEFGEHVAGRHESFEGCLTNVESSV